MFLNFNTGNLKISTGSVFHSSCSHAESLFSLYKVSHSIVYYTCNEISCSIVSITGQCPACIFKSF